MHTQSGAHFARLTGCISCTLNRVHILHTHRVHSLHPKLDPKLVPVSVYLLHTTRSAFTASQVRPQAGPCIRVLVTHHSQCIHCIPSWIPSRFLHPCTCYTPLAVHYCILATQQCIHCIPAAQQCIHCIPATPQCIHCIPTTQQCIHSLHLTLQTIC